MEDPPLKKKYSIPKQVRDVTELARKERTLDSETLTQLIAETLPLIVPKNKIRNFNQITSDNIENTFPKFRYPSEPDIISGFTKLPEITNIFPDLKIILKLKEEAPYKNDYPIQNLPPLRINYE